MSVIAMKALLESGVHFGHRTNKWNPAMKPYIFTERNGIHIIDLQQTVKALNNAYALIRDTVAGGGVMLFVGTKRQAQETVLEEAIRCGMPYVTERWLGGILTNWMTMHQRIVELERLEKLVSSGEVENLTKKEGLLIQREIIRLESRLSGIRAMTRLPDLLFIVDVMREVAAVHEANLLNIPVVALVDTNCDPSKIDYVIPSNDDAIRAIKLLVAKIADAVLEGQAMRKDEQEILAQAQTPSAAAEAAALEKAVARVIEMEEELEDEVLLGEATLAKLTPSRKSGDDEDEEIEEEVKIEEKIKEKKEEKKEVKKEVKKKEKKEEKEEKEEIKEEKKKEKIKEKKEEKKKSNEKDEKKKESKGKK